MKTILIETVVQAIVFGRLTTEQTSISFASEHHIIKNLRTLLRLGIWGTINATKLYKVKANSIAILGASCENILWSIFKGDLHRSKFTSLWGSAKDQKQNAAAHLDQLETTYDVFYLCSGKTIRQYETDDFATL